VLDLMLTDKSTSREPEPQTQPVEATPPRTPSHHTGSCAPINRSAAPTRKVTLDRPGETATGCCCIRPRRSPRGSRLLTLLHHCRPRARRPRGPSHQRAERPRPSDRRGFCPEPAHRPALGRVGDRVGWTLCGAALTRNPSSKALQSRIDGPARRLRTRSRTPICKGCSISASSMPFLAVPSLPTSVSSSVIGGYALRDIEHMHWYEVLCITQPSTGFARSGASLT